MKEITISIPNMQHTHCQTRVSNAVKEIKGVQIQKLEAGKITLSIEAENLEEIVETAIEKAGYSIE